MDAEYRWSQVPKMQALLNQWLLSYLWKSFSFISSYKNMTLAVTLGTSVAKCATVNGKHRITQSVEINNDNSMSLRSTSFTTQLGKLLSLIPRLQDWASVKQTSSRPDGTPPPGSNVGLGLAHSRSRVI